MARPFLGIFVCSLVLLLLFWGPRVEVARWPQDSCAAFRAWIKRSRWQEDVGAHLPRDAQAQKAWHSVGSDVATWVGWPSGKASTKFAAFAPHSLDQILALPALQTGSFLIVIPGSTKPRRRLPCEPFLTANSTRGSALSEVLPLAQLNAAADVLEATLLNGRRLHKFNIDVAELPLCGTGTGACAVWEGGSGRIVLHKGLVTKMARGPGVIQLMAHFARLLPEKLAELVAASGDFGKPGSMAVKSAGLDAKQQFVGAASVGTVVSRAAGAILAAMFASSLPVWWCLACPIALGMLAPLALNFGLTAAAEQLCAVLQLSAEECADLWWAAFALAMVLSLGAAVPIVYVCRLPDCVKHMLSSQR